MGWKLKNQSLQNTKENSINIHPKNLKYNSSLLPFFIRLKKKKSSIQEQKPTT